VRHDGDNGLCEGDGDGVTAADDNCPDDDNPLQEDVDCDGHRGRMRPRQRGRVLRSPTRTPFRMTTTTVPTTRTQQADRDCDDVGDACDSDPKQKHLRRGRRPRSRQLDNCPLRWNPARRPTSTAT
jgi:hypothetical protein